MGRGTALVLLAVMSIGAFLSGLELMITAVALPAIVVDLADWTQLRPASWIINGYLLVSIVVMPLAGQLSDRYGIRRVFLWALAVFIAGSILAGRSTTLAELIAARLFQAVGGGALVPVATAAASHVFQGEGARARSLGVVGALTFLGMAAGPFAGAWILQSIHPGGALDALRLTGGVRDALEDPWRYVFYLNVPIGLATLALGWAATAGWSLPRRETRLDLAGAAFVSIGLAALLVGITLAGSEPIPGLPVDSPVLAAALGALAALFLALALWIGTRREDPFIDPSWFRAPGFSSAAIVSLLTGYGFATAIIGGAVFVDRVLYGGPDLQRIALGSLAAATAVGALASGLVLRALGLRLTTVAGLAAAIVGLIRMAAWTPETEIGEVALWLALFGLGFGLTVTPRSAAAVAALGDRAYGIASATVTVAREIGMAIGLATLTAFGSTIIDQLWAEVTATPDAYKAYIPATLQDRPFNDGLVVAALEQWASGEAAQILVGVFLVAAAVMAVAVLPALRYGARRRPPEGAAPA
ncbi:MAG TPA: MFS transporter [Candidatus Limnocylindrales bacterium]|nr:MFS transporter [Candidatus Limnocylindrales bacterium]